MPAYGEFVNDLVVDGRDSDMLSVLCLSSVVQKPIQTFWPFDSDTAFSPSFQQLVRGRNVATSGAINVLWTALKYDRQSPVIGINHFVTLLDRPIEAPPVESVCVLGDVATSAADAAEAVDHPADDDANRVAVGGAQLKKGFLATADVIRLMQQTNPEDVLLTEIPRGIKNNVYFVVGGLCSNETRHSYWDDCGAWGGGNGKRKYFRADSLVEVRRTADGLSYGTRKIRDGKSTIEPFQVQPAVVELTNLASIMLH